MLIYLQNIFWKKLIHWEKMATLMAPEEATCKQLPLVWNEKTACIEPVLLDSLAIECLHRVREVPVQSQTKDCVIPRLLNGTSGSLVRHSTFKEKHWLFLKKINTIAILPSLRALWKIDWYQLSSLVKYCRKQTNKQNTYQSWDLKLNNKFDGLAELRAFMEKSLLF